VGEARSWLVSIGAQPSDRNAVSGPVAERCRSRMVRCS
jgi:hypothetical protein